jgi:hypothetical protein
VGLLPQAVTPMHSTAVKKSEAALNIAAVGMNESCPNQTAGVEPGEFAAISVGVFM